jgi:hypothetical protein
MNSMNILEKIFPSHELEELLYVLFTSNEDLDEKYIKESFLKFDSVFRILGISDEINKENYVNKRVCDLNKSNCKTIQLHCTNCKTIQIQPKLKKNCCFLV